MSSSELFRLLQTSSDQASKVAFDHYYGKLAAIALRYSKNQNQADELFNKAFSTCLEKLKWFKQAPLDVDEFMESTFIEEAVAFVKSVRSEYFVSSTVYAPAEVRNRNYDLFDNSELPDLSSLDNDVLIKGLQQLVPSQRLVYNLHVIEGYDLPKTAAVLESSEGTVKSNLEKARFNLQKNIEKTIKTSRA